MYCTSVLLYKVYLTYIDWDVVDSFVAFIEEFWIFFAILATFCFFVGDFQRFLLILFLQFCTLIGMWSIPLLLSLKNLWWRFIGLWLLFTLVTAAIMKRAMEKPIQGSTPRYCNNSHFLKGNSKCTLDHEKQRKITEFLRFLDQLA